MKKLYLLLSLCVLALGLNAQTVTSNSPVCEGATILLSVPNTAGATYSWTGPNGFTANTASVSISNATSANAGTYDITVTGFGQTVTATTSVVVNPTTFFGGTAQGNSCGTNCTGFISLSGQGVYTYMMNGATQTGTSVVFQGLCAGVYNVTASNTFGCSSNQIITVAQPVQLTATIADNAPTYCATVTGGTAPYMFTWSNGAATSCIQTTSPGTYCVTITDANGCSTTACTTVSNCPNPPSFGALIVDASCGACNGAFNISGQGVYTYTLMGNGLVFPTQTGTSVTFGQLCAGTYTITADDNAGCTSIQTYTIISAPAMIAVAAPQSASCGLANGSICATVSGGTAPYTYYWNTNQTTACINSIAAGAYTCTITDANGCTATVSTSVGTTGPAQVSISSLSSVCLGNTLQINTTIGGGTAPFTYSWATSGPGLSNYNVANPLLAWTIAGTYTYVVTVTGANGCTSSASRVITIQQCSGSAPIANVDQAATTEDSPAITINVAANDTDVDNDLNPSGVTIFGVPQHGTATVLSTGEILYQPNPNFCGTDILVYQICDLANNCTTGDAIISVSCVNDAPVAVNNNISVMSGQTASIYVGNNDYDSDSYAMSYTIVAGPNHGTATINPNNGLTTYTANATYVGLDTITYTICDSAALCSTAFVFINVTPQPTCNIVLTGQASGAVCNQANGAAYLYFTGSNMVAPYTITMNGTVLATVTTFQYTAQALAPGAYVFQVSDANGCQSSPFTIVVQSNNSTWFSIPISVTPASCGLADGSATVTIPNALGYVWSNGQSGATATGLASGYYSVTVTQTAGCQSHTNVYVPHSPSCYSTISGYVYDDHIDANCAPDNATGVAYAYVYITNSAGNYVVGGYTYSNGFYSFSVYDNDSYTVHYGNYYQACGWNYYYSQLVPICGTTRGVVINGFGTTASGNNFYVTYPPQQHNCSVAAWSSGTARPLIPRLYTVRVYNNGSYPESGTATLQYNQYISNVVQNTPWALHDVATRTITWNYSNLAPGASISFNVYLTLDAAAPLGQYVYTYSAITMNGVTDACPSDNTYDWIQMITNSYDPNAKAVNVPDQFEVNTEADSTLTYRIDFQNTGTDTAYAVVLKDAIDLSKFEINSINPLYATHPFRMEREGNNVVVFRFDNIYLPHAAIDEPGSHGYVVFTIRMRGGLPVGTTVENTADIYFDYNEAIITNTTSNTILEPNSVPTVNLAHLAASLQPNPSQSTTTLLYNLPNASAVNITVTDLMGRTVQTVANNAIQAAGEHQLSLTSLNAGTYLVQIRTNEGIAVLKWNVF